jgi:hypothetical protein
MTFATAASFRARIADGDAQAGSLAASPALQRAPCCGETGSRSRGCSGAA